MLTTRLSTKGRIVIPRNVRTSRGWRPGAEFKVEETGGGILLRPAARFPAATLDDVAGCLRSKRRPGTAAHRRTAIARKVARRHDSGRY